MPPTILLQPDGTEWSDVETFRVWYKEQAEAEAEKTSRKNLAGFALRVAVAEYVNMAEIVRDDASLMEFLKKQTPDLPQNNQDFLNIAKETVFMIHDYKRWRSKLRNDQYLFKIMKKIFQCSITKSPIFKVIDQPESLILLYVFDVEREVNSLYCSQEEDSANFSRIIAKLDSTLRPILDNVKRSVEISREQQRLGQQSHNEQVKLDREERFKAFARGVQALEPGDLEFLNKIVSRGLLIRPSGEGAERRLRFLDEEAKQQAQEELRARFDIQL